MLTIKKFMNELKARVLDEFELSKDKYENSRSDAAVDARIMVVGVLVRDGWSEVEICKATGWKQQRVNWLKNHFDERMKRRMFREVWSVVKN